MLGDLLAQENITYQNTMAVLDAIKQNSLIYTAYSNVFDLQRNLLYLVYASQFDEIIELNITHELSLPQHHYIIRDLFSTETQENAIKLISGLKAKFYLSRIGIYLAIAVVLFLIIFIPIKLVQRNRKKRVDSSTSL